jgi:hypothetical protein
MTAGAEKAGAGWPISHGTWSVMYWITARGAGVVWKDLRALAEVLSSCFCCQLLGAALQQEAVARVRPWLLCVLKAACNKATHEIQHIENMSH